MRVGRVDCVWEGFPTRPTHKPAFSNINFIKLIFNNVYSCVGRVSNCFQPVPHDSLFLGSDRDRISHGMRAAMRNRDEDLLGAESIGKLRDLSAQGNVSSSARV